MALHGRAVPLHRVGCDRLACIRYEEILEKMLPKRDSEDLNLKVLLWDFQHDSSYACLRLLGLGAQLRFRQCGEHVSKQALPRAGALEAFSCSAAASKFIFVVRSGITATGNPTATANLAKALELSRPASLQATARSGPVAGASWCARPGHGCLAVEVGQKCRNNVYETAARVCGALRAYTRHTLPSKNWPKLANPQH